jgi:hypothetical protein
MTRSTEQFVRELAQDARPVRRIAHPYTRTAIWMTLSIAYVGAVLLVMPVRHDLAVKLSDTSFIVEQITALTTGVAAALAAFVTVIPGWSRKWVLLPLFPFAIWLGSLGPGCIQELNRFGLHALPLQHSLWCFPSIVLIGAVPAIAMTVMLRRGAPLTPHVTAALGGLAAAGIGNLGVRVIHPEDVSIMLVVWHVGGVMLLCALAASVGRYFLNWHRIIAASQNTAR